MYKQLEIEHNRFNQHSMLEDHTIADGEESATLPETRKDTNKPKKK